MMDNIYESSFSPQIKNTKVGDIISVEEEIDGENQPVKYKVIEVYTYIVRAVRNSGRIRRCFSYGDLVIMGKEGKI